MRENPLPLGAFLTAEVSKPGNVIPHQVEDCLQRRNGRPWDIRIVELAIGPHPLKYFYSCVLTEPGAERIILHAHVPFTSCIISQPNIHLIGNYMDQNPHTGIEPKTGSNILAEGNVFKNYANVRMQNVNRVKPSVCIARALCRRLSVTAHSQSQ